MLEEMLLYCYGKVTLSCHVASKHNQDFQDHVKHKMRYFKVTKKKNPLILFVDRIENAGQNANIMTHTEY